MIGISGRKRALISSATSPARKAGNGCGGGGGPRLSGCGGGTGAAVAALPLRGLVSVNAGAAGRAVAGGICVADCEGACSAAAGGVCACAPSNDSSTANNANAGTQPLCGHDLTVIVCAFRPKSRQFQAKARPLVTTAKQLSAGASCRFRPSGGCVHRRSFIEERQVRHGRREADRTLRL